jgi:hypothetical protein
MVTKCFRIVYLDPLSSTQKVLVYDQFTCGLASVRR